MNYPFNPSLTYLKSLIMLTNKSLYTLYILLAGLHGFLQSLNVCHAQGYTVHNIPSPHLIYFNYHNMQKDSVCVWLFITVVPYLDLYKSGILQSIIFSIHNPESSIQFVFWQLPFKQIHKIPQWSPHIVMLTMSLNHCSCSLLLSFSHN